MEDKIKVSKVKGYTAEISPIVLCLSPTIQMQLEMYQVNNNSKPIENIKGKFVLKRKNKEIENFENLERFTKRSIRAGQMIEIQLTSEETFKLAKGLIDRYRLLYGSNTPLEDTEFIKPDSSVLAIKEMMENQPKLVKFLESIDLEALNTTINCENLKRIRNEIRDNMDNGQEVKFWQKLFKENAWVLSQLFANPYVLMDDEGYLGGKSINNSGGKYVDYVYKNELTKNIALIEIKTPITKLMEDKPYRKPDIYHGSSHLNGAVNQVLAYRDTTYKDYYNISGKSSEDYKAINIDSYLVIGTIGNLNKDQLYNFEILRHEYRSINIICFDELLCKIDMMINLLEEN